MESRSGNAVKRAALTATLALVATDVFAQGSCHEEGDFANFFRRFSDDVTFQKARLPASVRYGAWWAAGDKREFQWKERSREELLTSPSGRVVPTTADQAKLFVVKTSQPRDGRVDVNVVRDESDSFDSTFSFRIVNGCWVLDEIRDNYLDDSRI
jgi:hypothetical protein